MEITLPEVEMDNTLLITVCNSRWGITQIYNLGF